MTQVNEYGNIINMTIAERTERYTTRRSAELRGDRNILSADERTEKYTARRLAELRGETVEQNTIQDHPYVKRRLAELRRGNE